MILSEPSSILPPILNRPSQGSRLVAWPISVAVRSANTMSFMRTCASPILHRARRLNMRALSMRQHLRTLSVRWFGEGRPLGRPMSSRRVLRARTQVVKMDSPRSYWTAMTLWLSYSRILLATQSRLHEFNRLVTNPSPFRASQPASAPVADLQDTNLVLPG